VQQNGLPISPERQNQKSGFSPATPFFVYFKAGVDPANFPGTLEESITAQSAVQVIRASDGTRVPVMAELDANALPGDRQALIVRPMTRLLPGERYLIALLGLKDASGRALVPAPFKALRDHEPLSHALSAISGQAEDIFSRLLQAGVARASLSLAWAVRTAADDAPNRLVQMRDQALAMVPQLGYAIVQSSDSPGDPNLLRQVQATVQVPQFLDESSSFLHFDDAGEPAVRALGDVPIVINIPQCSKNTAPLPLLVFGHGIFLNARDSLSYSAMQRLGNQECAVWAATDWTGLSTNDIADIARGISADLNSVYMIQDRLQQAQVNHLVMTRQLLSKLKDDPALSVGGRAVIDPTRAYYFGISNGGIEGVGLLALGPDLQRGVLNVPGADWSLLIWRSTDFNSFKPLLFGALPDQLDAQIYIGLIQSEWDYVDPGTFAPHLFAAPLPGGVPRPVLVQESIGDAQVTNLATRYLVRTLGLPGVALSEPVYGVTTQAAPLESAYTQWNSHPMPLPPASNTSLPMDTGAHNAVWLNDLAEQQIRAFLQPGGQVTDVCGGPCDI
jgi:hypothetical protein